MAFWEQWILDNPSKKEEWDTANALIGAVQAGLTEYSRSFLTADAEYALLERIRRTNKAHRPVVAINGRANWRWVYWSAAAAAILILGVYVWRQPEESTSLYASRVSKSESAVREYKNLDVSAHFYHLADSSVVKLWPNSRLSYFSDEARGVRTVYLSGHAEFDVVKNPARPFLVYANEVVTEVLGTSFEVKAFEKDSNVTVSVTRGKVSVYRSGRDENTRDHGKKQGVLLLPNQRVVFKRAVQEFSKELIEKPAVLSQKDSDGLFVFEETPIAQVFASISQAYGVEIIFNEEILAHCQLSASLTEETLTEKLDIICKSIDAEYDIVEAQIIVHSKGCQAFEP